LFQFHPDFARNGKGEITLLIGKGQVRAEHAHEKNLSLHLQAIMREQHLDEKAALKILAKERGLSKSEAYREVQRTQSRLPRR